MTTTLVIVISNESSNEKSLTQYLQELILLLNIYAILEKCENRSYSKYIIFMECEIKFTQIMLYLEMMANCK